MSHVPPQFQPSPPAGDHGPGPPPDGAPVPDHAPPAELAGRSAWPPWLALAAFIAGFGVTILAGAFVIGIVSAVGGSASSPPTGVNVGLTVIQNLALVGAAFFFAAMHGRPSAFDFGLRRPPVKRAIRLLFAVWIGFYALSAAWAAALSLDQQQTLPSELGADGPLLNVLAVVVLITVIAPLGEELFFRGFFYGALRNWRGPWVAAVLTGVVFGGIHAGSSPLGYLVPLAIFGVGLCLLYEWSGSLYPSIALHALNNSIALGVLLSWSWQIPAMMVGSTIVTLTIASLLARLLGTGGRAGPLSAPAPGPGAP
ncbi:MAG: type II CAAX endopeptidase family protein [Solirubrobacteraceae bacterium]|nr:type II CAAX endopeptidase family protein [Solirubrobacteraceae bacterium]